VFWNKTGRKGGKNQVKGLNQRKKKKKKAHVPKRMGGGMTKKNLSGGFEKSCENKGGTSVGQKADKDKNNK